MVLDNKINNEEKLLQLARERQGFYKGKEGYYIWTVDRGDDALLLRHKERSYTSNSPELKRFLLKEKPIIEELLEVARFGVYEIGFPGLEPLDLAQIQLHDIIAGPFDSYPDAVEIIPYVIRIRYRTDVFVEGKLK